jgi:RNA polymerase sigma-70 factor (ECF subfamily)
MSAVSGAMSEGKPPSGKAAEGATTLADLLKQHAPVMGRVAMALLGDAAHVERALEQVAREAGARSAPEGAKPLAWLLGLVRAASATQLSKLPLRSRTGADRDAAPSTERLGASVAVPARTALGALPPTEREAVVLSLVGGLEAADVAVACNVDVGTAKTRIARGVQQLHGALADGVESNGSTR